MNGESPTSKLDAPRLLYDSGERAQVVAVIMWKHEIAAELGVCKGCGRLPARELPLFGPRCEIAVNAWDLAHVSMLRLVQPAVPSASLPRAVGRVPAPPSER